MAKCFAWAIITPPWTTPDEPVHFAYVQRLAIQHRLPAAGTFSQTSLSPQESAVLSASNRAATTGQPATGAMAYTRSQAQNLREVLSRHLSGDGGAHLYIGGYPPLYYLLNVPAYWLAGHSLLSKLFVMRLESSLLGVLACLILYGLVLDIAGPSIVAAAVLAYGMLPEMSMIYASVNNDVLVDFLGVVLLVPLLGKRGVKAGAARGVLWGVVCGFALLSKAEAWPLIVVVGCGLFVAWYRKDDGLRTFLVTALTAGILYSPWAIYSWVHYKSIVGVIAPGSGDVVLSLRTFITSEFSRLYSLWTVMFTADVGWLNVLVGRYWYWTCAGWEVMAGFACGVVMWGATHGVKACAGPARVIGRCLLYAGALLAFLYYAEWRYVRLYHAYMLQGRYLLPAYGAMVIAGLLALDGLSGARYTKPLCVVVGVFVVALNAATLVSMVHQYYGIGVVL